MSETMMDDVIRIERANGKDTYMAGTILRKDTVLIITIPFPRRDIAQKALETILKDLDK
jgi:hypothetical protein